MGSSGAAPEHLDVLVVGAGLSGIGAACRLVQRRPGSTFAVLEARAGLGGTWDLFRYPGIRSDSDMATFGYPFRPWTSPRTIADGASIRRYLAATAREFGVERRIRYGHRVVDASWSSSQARWTVTARRPDGHTVVLTCRFLLVCSGYYRYDAGNTPDLPGASDFTGRIVHPQHWPADLDVRGRRVVVVGSGATAVTLVPALARTAASVTMLQRSPGYVLAIPSRDAVAALAHRVLPARAATAAVRWKNVLISAAGYVVARRLPRPTGSLLRRRVAAALPPGYPVDPHFTPAYAPWDQRMCLAPDGDLFAAIRAGRVEVVTDLIARLTPDGVALASGRRLDADVVVTATGLRLLPLGGIALAVDGRAVDLPSTVAYKGMMLSGVPNLAFVFGYAHASWTLKSDLVSEYVCRLLDHLDARGYGVCTPLEPPTPEREPLIDLRSGYVLRGLADLPRQGTRYPWRLHQSYLRDARLLRRAPVQDEGVRFERACGRTPAPPTGRR